MSLTLAIMAGGKSSRMGTDKSFVTLLGKPLIEHLLDQLADLGEDERILITNRPDDYATLGLPMFTDVLPDKGSLGGIYTAITHSQTDYTLVMACDMPFANPALLKYMMGLCDGTHDVIVPRVDNYPEGLHAIYSQACLAPIRKRLEADQLKVMGFYDDVRVRYLDEAEYQPFDPKGLSFFNVNTPQELEEARRLAGE
ncbi:MAG: putative molybdenum cofactor guanylyltransferase [Chloroflexota bacterium]|nr:molybdenum cofactor guanylyltransferase [Chloroflexota bacterium]NOG63248.1 molybdenum cofactor guanylyltransferase [Chloroflexota bacterium]GIK64506.1 MAG: putative molybdenum cofactor guanylyltransferase [Chloroflexota bacterium]